MKDFDLSDFFSSHLTWCLLAAPSGPPRSVAGSPRSNSSIILQWHSPDPSVWNGRLLGYVIRYKPAGYPDSTVSFDNVTLFKNIMAREVRGLIMFLEYQISVAAYNQRGVGVFSNWVLVRTNEGRPTAQPSKVTGVALTSTSIHVSWMPPNPQYINGISQGYHVNVEMMFSGEKKLDQFVVPSNTSNMLGVQSTVLKGLLKYVEYDISVSCFTSVGDGPRSAPISVRTLEDGECLVMVGIGPVFYHLSYVCEGKIICLSCLRLSPWIF